MTGAGPVRYGVIGCAGIGQEHADAVEAAEGTSLVAGADLDASAAETFAAERDVIGFTDVATMIEAADLDAVSVCTPSGTHADVVEEAAGAGADVLCEKPLDVYADRIDRMIAAADDAGATLAGVFQKRCFESSRLAKEAVADGDLGSLVLADATVKWYRSQEYYDSAAWRGTRDSDGGVLLNQAIHAIDLLDWLGGGIETVRARTGRLARELECEDTAVLSVRFENGALGAIEATTATRGGQSGIELNGTEGSLSLEGSSVTHFDTADGEREVETAEFAWGDAHCVAVQEFVDALREDRAPPVPASEARRAVDVVLAAYASAERGGEEVPIEAVREGLQPLD